MACNFYSNPFSADRFLKEINENKYIKTNFPSNAERQIGTIIKSCLFSEITSKPEKYDC